MICTFFGHRVVTKEIEPTLRSVLIDLIENHNVNTFYVGNNGEFDLMAQNILKKLADKYKITFFVVLAYIPQKIDFVNTILPIGIEFVPKRYAISFRNKWMISKSDYVITYVEYNAGSKSSKFKKLAEKQGKTVICI